MLYCSTIPVFHFRDSLGYPWLGGFGGKKEGRHHDQRPSFVYDLGTNLSLILCAVYFVQIPTLRSVIALYIPMLRS